MKVKKFSSPTVPEALAAVRREFGENAVILSTRRVDGGFEVVAGDDSPAPAVFPRVDRDGNALDRAPARARAVNGQPVPIPVETARTRARVAARYGGAVGPADHHPAFDAAPQVRETATPMHAVASVATVEERPAPAARQGARTAVDPAPTDRAALVDELHALRGRLETMTDLLLTGTPSDVSPDARRLHLTLTETGLDPHLATVLVRRVEAQEGSPDVALTRVLSSAVRTGGPIARGAGQQVIALVGPTGVGKTTTVAKLAAHLTLEERRSVALVSADSVRVGGADQLAFYAEILQLPFRTAHDRASLAAAIGAAGNAEVVLVDTTGRGGVDAAGAAEVADVLSVDPRTQSWLVLSAVGSTLDNLSALRTFSCAHPSGLVVTKVDETSAHGTIATVAIRSGLPLRYLTDGQLVPDDLVLAEPRSLGRLILEGACR